MTVASSAGTLAAPEPLLFRRLHRPNGEAPIPHALGGRWVGAGALALPMRLLGPLDSAVFDAWGAGAPVAPAQQFGCVRYASDGHWLHGIAEIDDRAVGLERASRKAYADIYAVLAGADAAPRWHPLQLWNYMAEINRETDGLERYRQFNAGRRQACIAAGRSAFEGAPAACALGVPHGPLRIYFLAGRSAPRAIENPRQVSAYRYPEAYGPIAPSFSRAVLAEAGDGRSVLLISGTASIVGHASVHPGDVRRQTDESLANLAAVREVAAAQVGVPIDARDLTYTVYLRRAADLVPVRERFETAVGSAAANQAIYLQADVCRAELLVEIEAHGFVQAMPRCR